MKKICDWLCPQRERDQVSYDVHEETFEMDENLGEPDFADKATDPNILSELKKEEEAQSTENLTDVPSQDNGEANISQDDERKFIENKNKADQNHTPETLIASSSSELQNSSEEKPLAVNNEVSLLEAPPKPKYNILSSSTKKKKFNPEDYQFKQEENEFKVKQLDSLKGQQFNIDSCKNGKYFVFDITANIYIDDCENCFIYAAPCESSIFVRNCKNMIIVCSTGQFRTYNCHGCHFSIFCKSQPVIESSSDIHFSSLQCPEYEALAQQFKGFGFFGWNNNWSQIHNFTKKEGEVDYYLEKEPSFIEEIDWNKAFAEAKVDMTNNDQQIVPFIQGALPIEETKPALVIFSKEESEKDIEILKWIKENNILLLRSSKSKVDNQKYLTIALMINNENEEELNFGEIGDPLIIRDKEEIEGSMSKYFVSFKDER